jgi:hypothetical protein
MSSSAKNPLKTGTLRKKGTLGAWRKKQLVLLPQAMLVYTSDVFQALAPNDSVRLTSLTEVSDPASQAVRGGSAMTHTVFAFSMSREDGDSVWLAADSEQYAKEWTSAIRQAVSKLDGAGGGLSKPTVSFGEDAPVRMTKSRKQLNLRENMRRAASVGTFSLSSVVSDTLRLITKSNWVGGAPAATEVGGCMADARPHRTRWTALLRRRFWCPTGCA